MMNFDGKKSVTVVTTMSNGQYEVSKYLHKVQTVIGFKNLNSHIFLRVDDLINSFIEECSIDCIDKITNDYGYSNSILENQFLLLKNNYTKFKKEKIKILGNKCGVEYWNQK